MKDFYYYGAMSEHSLRTIYIAAHNNRIADEICSQYFPEGYAKRKEDDDYKIPKRYAAILSRYKVTQGYVTEYSSIPVAYISRLDIIDEALKDMENE